MCNFYAKLTFCLAFDTMSTIYTINLKRLFIFLFLVNLFIPLNVKAQSSKKKILLLEIRDEINPGMSRAVEMALAEATKIKADYVLVDMDTYGGLVSDADKIRKLFLQFPTPIFVFINNNAASAGALISIACDSIYMAPGASIGASTVVDQEGKAVSDKYQSYMRSTFRSTAEANGRNPDIAAAMVGQNIAGDSIYKEGKVLTLSTSEAIKVNYCDGQVNSIKEVLAKNNITNYEIQKFELSTLHKIEAFFLNPVLRSILILLILAGIYFEMQSPGIGFAIVVSIVAAILYFVPSYLHGFAQSWEILVFIFGIVLIVLEIFVIPGFGVAGISGIALTLAGLVLVMLQNDFFDFSMVSTSSIVEALTVMIIGIVGGVVVLIIGGKKILESKAFRRLTLQDTLDTKEGYTSSFLKESMIGKTGTAYTVLRPSGKVLIEEQVYDAFSRNEFIEQGTEVIVVEESTTSLKVKKV
jgi:membrane-bound serine protease (ClpP class)